MVDYPGQGQPRRHWTRSTSTASTSPLPYRQDFWLLYYNKDLFKAAGVEDPDHV